MLYIVINNFSKYFHSQIIKYCTFFTLHVYVTYVRDYVRACENRTRHSNIHFFLSQGINSAL